MTTLRRRKCLCCKTLFKPDPRQKNRQRYCSQSACRKASKAASQKKWLNKPENRQYFAGHDNVARVQAWRAAHPDYWRNNKPLLSAAPLQDSSLAQATDISTETGHLTALPLQELIALQAPVLIGIIAQLTGDTLQDQIANSTRRLLTLGADILTNTKTQAKPPQGEFDESNPPKPPATSPNTQAVQLG